MKATIVKCNKCEKLLEKNKLDYNEGWKHIQVQYGGSVAIGDLCTDCSKQWWEVNRQFRLDVI